VRASVLDNEFVKVLDVEQMLMLAKSGNRFEGDGHEPMERHQRTRCHQNHMKAGQVSHTDSCYL